MNSLLDREILIIKEGKWYIEDDTNKTNNGLSYVGKVENSTITKEKFSIIDMDIDRNNGAIYTFSESERLLNTLFRIDNIIPIANHSSDGWVYEQVLSNKDKSDIIYKHTNPNTQKTLIPSIIELKNATDNNEEQKQNEAELQYNRYFEAIQNKGLYEISTRILLISIVVNVEKLFNNINEINNLKYHINDENSEYIKITTTDYNNKEKSKSIIKGSGIPCTFEYYEKSNELRKRTIAKINTSTYYAIPTVLSSMDNLTNPRELLQKDSYVIFNKILRSIITHVDTGEKHPFDINEYTREKVVLCSIKPLELHNNPDGSGLIFSNFSLGDGQRSSYAISILYKWLHKDETLTKEESDMIIQKLKLLNNSNFPNTKLDTEDILTSFKKEYIQKCEFIDGNLNFTLKTNVSISNNKNIKDDKSLSKNFSNIVEEISDKPYETIIRDFNNLLFDYDWQIKWPHIKKIEKNKEIELNMFYRILNIVINPNSSIFDRANLNTNKIDKLFQKFEANNDKKIKILSDIKQNQDRIKEIKDMFDEQNLSDTAISTIDNHQESIINLQKQLNSLPRYESLNKLKTKGKSLKEKYLKVFQIMNKYVETHELDTSIVIADMLLNYEYNSNIKEDDIITLALLFSNIETEILPYVNLNNKNGFLNGSYTETIKKIIYNSLTSNQKNIKDFCIKQLKNMVENHQTLESIKLHYTLDTKKFKEDMLNNLEFKITCKDCGTHNNNYILQTGKTFVHCSNNNCTNYI